MSSVLARLRRDAPPTIAPGHATRAILVTTYNRPAALARALPQLAALGHPLVVVDDGSDPGVRETNASIAAAAGVTYLALPGNRGLCAAMNVGLDYLMADRRIEWISYFQDDVDVDGRIMELMARVEDRAARPILTGYDADEHAAERRDTIGGVEVALKRTSPAVHLHAHVDYWHGVLPIPTEYLGAPRRRWEASLDDYWIVNHAPGSAARRGLLVVCIPGLVRTFLYDHADSTWGNPNDPDPALRS
jgi:glycosyltransferase involved in cell wall biosynthesis